MKIFQGTSSVNLMLDSGAYSVMSQGKEIDLEKYAEFVVEYGDHFEVCVNLDVIGDGKASYKNWLKLKSMGVETMPVFHANTDLKYLEKYIDKSDYIGIGAIANANTKQRRKNLNKVFKLLLDDRGEARCKLHGFGITSTEMLLRYPWYSVDSTTPAMITAYGQILIPRDQTDCLNMKNLVISNHRNQTKLGKNSYFYLSYPVRLFYNRLMEEAGFKVGHAYSESSEKTLVNDFGSRLRWNLIMWHEFIQAVNANKNRGQEVNVYVCGQAHVKAIADTNKYCQSSFGSLISFAEINNSSKMDRLNNVLNKHLML